MSIHVDRFEKAAELRAAAEPFLMRHEAEHNLILGLLGRLERAPDFYPSEPYFAAALRGGEPVAVAVMTPPFPVVVSRSEPNALPLLARDLAGFNPETTGVNAAAESAALFAEAWRGQTGETVELRLSERIYRLDKVRPPSGIEGEARPATPNDVELMTDWRMAFTREAIPWEASSPEETERMVRRMLGAPRDLAGTFLWHVEGRPVCMVGYSSPTPNSLRIAPVYTPPECRRHGFASACTAAVCQYILDGGKSFVTLFADLANPTSNHVYRAIGFEPVCDVGVYYFGGR